MTSDTCIDYISEWTNYFNQIMIFAWVALDQPPEWIFIESSAKYMVEMKRFDMESTDNDLFDQFTYLKKYVVVEKIQQWEENSVAIDQRWVEIFQHFAKNDVPYNHLLTIVSYILSLAGTSATVERVFSMINDVWTDAKTQLKIETLKDILYTRYNIKMNCLQFFEFIKTQPKMLEEIGKDDKYAFKQ